MAPIKKTEKLLRKLYFDPKNSGSFGGVDALYKAYRDAGGKAKISKIKDWLAKEETYTLHRPIIRKFKRSRVVVGGIDHQWQADLVDLSKLSTDNDGFKYLLTCIDVFSKYAWAVPIKDKTGKAVVMAFNTILKQRKPIRLQNDQGKEFVCSKFQALLKDRNIDFFTTYNEEIKAGICERFNRTLKNRMWRYFTKHNTNRYIDVLDKLVKSYNNSYHRSIGMKPINVNINNQEGVWMRLYGKPVVCKRFHFNVGDVVRISTVKKSFKKGYMKNWSRELFTVTKVLNSKPQRYLLSDYSGELLDGSFYGQEIQKVKTPNIFKIERVLEEKGPKIFVKWEGYPSKFNSWISKKSLKTYNGRID